MACLASPTTRESFPCDKVSPTATARLRHCMTEVSWNSSMKMWAYRSPVRSKMYGAGLSATTLEIMRFKVPSVRTLSSRWTA